MKTAHPLLRTGFAVFFLLLTGPLVQAQSAPAVAVPDEVAIPRPSEAEVKLARESLEEFLADAPAQVQAIAKEYPGLIDVRPPRVNTAIIPSLSGRFIEKHEMNKAVARAGDIDVLFMGDSITDWWRNESEPYAGKPVFDRYFGDLKVANFGIAGDTTEGVLYRLRNGEGQGFSPKAVMLMIGTNNTRLNTAEEIAEGIGAITLELQKDFPDAKILLLAVFPRNAPHDPLRTQIAGINRIISRLHDGERIIYMDIGEVFLDDSGFIPEDIMSDGLHPTTKGYELWAEAVNGTLRELL